MAIKGLKDIISKSAEQAEASSTPRTNYVYIGDGETALIRFINDDEIIQTKIHEYEEVNPQGKKYRKAYCIQNLTGETCKWCAAGNYPKNAYVASVYVYYIVHKKQNPQLEKDDKAVKWEVVKQGVQTLYKENVGEIRLLRVKFGKDSYLKTAIMKFVDEYSTLVDRDYRFSRTGGDKTTVYSFVPRDKSEASAAVIEAAKNAIPLTDILTGKKASTAAGTPETVSDSEPASVDEDIF